jgi:hypothetical protein
MMAVVKYYRAGLNGNVGVLVALVSRQPARILSGNLCTCKLPLHTLSVSRASVRFSKIVQESERCIELKETRLVDAQSDGYCSLVRTRSAPLPLSIAFVRFSYLPAGSPNLASCTKLFANRYLCKRPMFRGIVSLSKQSMHLPPLRLHAE